MRPWWDRGNVDFQSTELGSHDERCPSGTGRVKLAPLLPGMPERAAPQSEGEGARRGGIHGACSSRVATTSGSGRPLTGETRRAAAGQRNGASAPDAQRVVLPVLGQAGRVGGARKRTRARLAAPGFGIQAIAWSCSEVVSVAEVVRGAPGPRSKGRGPSLPGASRKARAQRAKRCRKPVRGGESHEPRGQRIGGGLLVIPRACVQTPCTTGGGSTRRWKASWSTRGRRL